MRAKITMQGIADSVGLSKYAVSRALAGKSGVSAQSRELILQKAAELGYRKEISPPVTPRRRDEQTQAEEERRQWTGTLLVLFPDVRSQNPESAYWGPLFEGISAALNQKGIHFVTLVKPDIHSLFSLLNPEAIIGVLAVGSIASPILHECRRLGKPVVMVDHWDKGFPCDSIFSDNLAGITEIMSTMLGKGYREYQFVGKIADAYSFYERWLGFNAALMDAGLPQHQIPALLQYEYEGCDEALREAFATRPLPQVFVCANDYYASLLAKAVKELDPSSEGVVFTGFDNSHAGVTVATVNVEEEILGVRAVDQLLWRILHPTASYERKLIRGRLVINE